jgi:hypothetical protein
MQLELSKEADVLRELISSSLVQLKGEIHDTDNVTFRRGLTHTRERLQTIKSRLSG